MTIYYQFMLRTLQPVKMGGTGSQVDNQNSLDYISGSALRGAFIGRYLRLHDCQLHEDDTERKRWLGGGIRFLNAYLMVDKMRGLPFPACLYASKEHLRQFAQTGHLTTVFNSLHQPVNDGMKRIPPKGYVAFNSDTIKVTQTRMQDQLHINLQREKTALYRYESIDVGQSFLFAIAVEENDAKIEKFLRSFDGQSLYLGGSKSSGYGKCLLRFMCSSTQDSEFVPHSFDNGTFFMYCTSDIILRDNCGRYLSQIPANLLREKLGVTVDIDNFAVQVVQIAGFNNKWGSRVPQVEAIQKGSVFLCHYNGDLAESRVRLVEDQGIGERRSDGFGRILFLSHFPSHNLERAQSEHIHSTEDGSSADSEQTKKDIRKIAKRILYNRIEEKWLGILHEWEKQNTPNLSNSLLADWMQRCIEIRRLRPEQGKQKINDDLDHMQNKYPDPVTGEINERTNRSVWQSLQKATFFGKPWVNYMREFIQTSDDPQALLNRLHIVMPPIAGNSPAQLLTAEDSYRLNMTMLYHYFREYRRVRDSSEEEGVK